MLCREQALRAAGFQDIFRSIKQKENEGALELLGEVLQEIDDIADPRQRWEAVVRGVFAGNIFDLGCAATTDMYHQVGRHTSRPQLATPLKTIAIHDLQTRQAAMGLLLLEAAVRSTA